MRWNPFRRAEPSAAADSGFESTVVDDAAAARLAAAGVPSEAAQVLEAAAAPPAEAPPVIAQAPASSSAKTAAAIADAPSIGHIGRYALKSILGQGGLGTVYAAWDPLLSRTVAVKTLHIDADPAARESLDALFLNEARAAAGLSHPHIVTVFDAGPAETGVYIAMERLQGQDLRHLLQQGARPSPIEAAQLVRRVADALAYAHRKGVVHCDIKPANIFMTGRMHPKVLDFGIARIAHREVVASLEGVAAGSPYYLAPEQIDGRSVDRRSDVYSLGVVLYELLAGQRPFGGSSLEDIQRAVKQGECEPAHRVSARVPLGLSVIASRAMAREPEQRYPSARHLSMELRHWVESAEARALMDGTRSTRTKTVPLSRQVARYASPAIGLTALALAGALWWVRAPSAAEARAAVAHAAASAATVASTPQEASSAPETVAQAPAAPTTEAPPAPVETAAADTAAADKPVAAASGAPAPQAASAAAGRKRKAQQVATNDAPATTATAAPSLGIVQLAVSPWGQIDVDGQALGTSPPLTRLTLTAGKHTVTVRNADFPSFVATLTVDAENPVTLRHRFGP
jgi:serine/threonine-protein kinase